MNKELQLENYSKTRLTALLGRTVKLLSPNELQEILGVKSDPNLKWVGFETANTLTNSGKEEWTKEGGTIGIWMLGMLNPSDSATVVIPYIQGDEKELGKIATTNYFGEIPADRIKIEDGFIYYKVDGKYRSKLGLSEKRAASLAGSYDPINKALTIMQFNKPDVSSEYINQMWEIQKEPFVGDVINSYNDGPLEDRGQLGPFYEIETSSPAAFLAPGESLLHTQRIFHFTGTEDQLNAISTEGLGLSIEKIKNAFNK